jgi:hypothetical protein
LNFCVLLVAKEPKFIAKGRRVQGRGQKDYYWYVAVSAVKSVLTLMVTAIKIESDNFLKT